MGRRDGLGDKERGERLGWHGGTPYIAVSSRFGWVGERSGEGLEAFLESGEEGLEALKFGEALALEGELFGVLVGWWGGREGLEVFLEGIKYLVEVFVELVACDNKDITAFDLNGEEEIVEEAGYLGLKFGVDLFVSEEVADAERPKQRKRSEEWCGDDGSTELHQHKARRSAWKGSGAQFLGEVESGLKAGGLLKESFIPTLERECRGSGR